jgi:hypothetical protein
MRPAPGLILAAVIASLAMSCNKSEPHQDLFQLPGGTDRSRDRAVIAADHNAVLPITFKLLLQDDRDSRILIAATAPDDVKKLAGQLVSIDGFVQPALELRQQCILRTTDFISAERDDAPRADEYLAVYLQSPWNGLPPTRKVRATGRFKIEDIRDAGTGEVLLFYHLENANMKILER